MSDELQHGAMSVYAFVTNIFTDVMQKYPTIQQINVFSDGASSQFKQRFLFSNLQMWEQQFHIELKWHFFATSHGKGVVDGLGGTIKHSVWRYVQSGKAQATTALSFFQVAVYRNPNIHNHLIPKSHTEKNKTTLKSNWDKTVPV